MLRRALIAFVLAGLAALAIAFEVPVCPTATLFGVPCPGCGLTRATLALLHGDVRRAFAFHPLVFVLAPLYFGALGAAAVSFVRGPSAARRRTWFTRRGVTVALWILLAIVLGVWIARFFGAFGGPVPVRTVWPVSLVRR